MLATRNSRDRETAVLTDCRQKCVNLGKFLKKKKVTALVHPFSGSWKEPMQTPENRGWHCSGSLARGQSARELRGVWIECIVETERET